MTQLNMDEQMYMIMARVLSREATTEEQQALQSWMAEAEENRMAFEEMSRLWTDADEVLSRPQFDTAAAWTKVEARIAPPVAEELVPTARKVAFFPTWLRNSIGIAAALLLGLFVYRSFSGPGMKEVLADAGTREVVLPDQSHVWLREGSSLRYPASFAGGHRKVSLKGEAFFDVTRDPGKPFLIDASCVEVQVLGTSFNVNTAGDDASVYVTTGKVQVRSAKKGDKVIVVPGELAELKNGSLNRRTVTGDLFEKTGVMSFSNTPLSIIVAEISRICRVPVKLDDHMPSRHRNQELNISFSAGQKLESMLTDLGAISGSKWEKQGEGYLIRVK